MSMTRWRTIESIAPWAASVLLAAPVLVAFYPPMTDLPYHEASLGLLRHFGDPSMFPPGLYRRNLGEPNQLFHMVGWALTYAMSTRWAIKLVVVAAVAAVPVCSARFARYVGASPLAALVVAPMALGWLFSWGLVANIVGLAALLAMLPVLDRLAMEPTPARAAQAVAGAVLLYFAHEAMLFVYGGAALGLALIHRGSVRQLLLRLAPLVSGAALAIAQARWQKHLVTPIVRMMPTLWDPVTTKIRRAPYILMPARDPGAHAAMVVLCLFVLASFAWLRAGERRARGDARAPGMRAWALAYRWEILAGACFVAYLLFPLALNGATLLYQRWFPPGFAVLAIVLAPRDLSVRPARVTRIAAAVLPVATLLVAGPSFADSSDVHESLAGLITSIEPASSVAALDLGPGFDRTFSLGPSAGRVLATRGGRLLYSFADSPISPVMIARRYQWNEAEVRDQFDPWRFSPAHDLRRFRYLLIRTNDPHLAWLVTYALQQEAEYIGSASEWMLFKSRLPVVPLLAPDVPLENPPPDTMRERIAVALAKARASSAEAPEVEVPPACDTPTDALTPRL
jgi:hypothetical protein